MIDKKQQIKNSFIYMLPIFIGNILPFISIPIFTRILSKEDYGILALAQIYAIFVSGIANFGMTIAYDRNFFQYRNNLKETAQLLYSTILFVLGSFCLLACLTWFFKGALAKLIIGSTVHGNILFWMFCAQFFSSVSYYFLTYFKNSEIAVEFVAYTIMYSIFNFSIALFLVAYIRMGVIGIVYGQLCSGMLTFIVLGCKFVKIMPPSLNKDILIESLKISYPLTPRIFFGVIGSQFDKYMIGLIASTGSVGIYSIGQKISNIVFTYMTAIQNVFSPQVYRRMFELGKEGGKSIGTYLTPFAYITVTVALFVSLFCEEIIFVLTPKSFHGAIDIITILSMYFSILFFGKQPQLEYVKKTYLISVLTFVGIGINIGINTPFIMKWGAVGAAWATFLAGTISSGIAFGISQYYYEIKWEYKKIGAIYLIFFISSILVLILRHADVEYYIRLLIKLFSVFIYAYAGCRINVITFENLVLIKNIFSGVPFRKVKVST